MTAATAVPVLAWLDEARPVLDTLADTQADAMEQASRWCADAIGSGGLVHLFGTGHSRIPVEEMFPRYGSYPGFNPIVELSMTFHTQVVGANGQRQAMAIERMSGLADVILEMKGEPDPETLHHSCPGLDANDPQLLEWISQSGLVAICADNTGVEVRAKGARKARSEGPRAFLPLHEHCLFKQGIHLGELWYFTELARWLARQDAAQDVVRFHVWSDSFETYLEARTRVEAAGFRASWTGHEADQEFPIHLRFGMPEPTVRPIEVD